jgi:hypothetical protein
MHVRTAERVAHACTAGRYLDTQKLSLQTATPLAIAQQPTPAPTEPPSTGSSGWVAAAT